ncbi:uncharacterized protein LOC131436806 [Malaya genurostris]|uniref:uncharacterized protein LOC131436806 n=1 Tax=Malaya genurostris TaxID=325434 RepID=UPI0026F3EA20|nr:uncharacterized protein LOC131436806 [Malaya genurostris]
MHRKRYFPADLVSHPLHYAALRGYFDQVKQLIVTGYNVYEPIQDGETAAHVAIVENQPEVARLLLQEYRKDFEFVQEKITQDYRCDDNSDFLLNKSILLAVNDHQREMVEQLCEPICFNNTLMEATLILIKQPNGRKNLVVIHKNTNNYLQLFKLVKQLLPNGLLSWNSTGLQGKCETFLQLVAYHGKADLLEFLVSCGANLSNVGSGKRTPLHSACEASQNTIVEILVSKYGNSLDLTALDENCEHALHYVLKRKNKYVFKLLLDAMVDYQNRASGDSKSAAFNFIFKLENKEYPNTSLWSQLDTVFWGEMIGIELERYQYDLSYKWEHVTALIDMVTYKKARKYYLSQIVQKPKLLKVSNKYGFTVLHALIGSNELHTIEELYSGVPDVMELFECNAAIPTLAELMMNGFADMTSFVLEHHKAFFQQKITDVCEKIVMEYTAPNYDVMFGMLQKFLPGIESFLVQRKTWLNENSYAALIEYDEMYNNLLDDFSTTMENLEKVDKTINDYNSSTGRCFLSRAVQENQLELVEQLLKAGIDFEYTDTDERHAIHWVKSVEMLHLLTSKHPDGTSLIHRKDRNGMNLLHVLCPDKTSDREKLILELLRLGARIDERTHDQATVLFFTYDEELFCFLTEELKSKGFHGIDTDLRDFEGKTALHMQLRHCNSHIASVMLRAAPSWVSFTNKGDSYLSYLIGFEPDLFDVVFRPILEMNPEKTEQMFRAELNASRDRCSELFVKACLQGNTYCIDKFLDMDLDFNIRDYRGMVGLLTLLDSNELLQPMFVERLLQKEVDVNLQDNAGRNALMILGQNYAKAKEKGYSIETVKDLINRGAKIDEIDRTGETVLHYAFKLMELDLIKVLLEAGANFRMMSSVGKAPYEVAPSGISELFSFLC